MMDRRKLKPQKCVTGVYHLVTNLLLSVFRICDLFGSCLNIEIAAEQFTKHWGKPFIVSYTYFASEV